MFSLKDASALAREPEVAAAIDAADRYLLQASGPERFRQARSSGSAAPDIAAYRGLAKLGITRALIPEELGGSGLPPGVSALIGERLGWSLAREPFVENVVLPCTLLLELHAIALMHTGSEEPIPCVAWQEGDFVLPEPGTIGTQAWRTGGLVRIQGCKRFVMGARASTEMFVLAAMAGDPVIVRVASDAPGVKRHDKVLADGTCWSDVDFDVAVDAAAVLARGTECTAALRRALAVANLASAGMLHGLQSRVLVLTLEYLRTRVQFDKPIGAFQALQHRAVDLYTQAQISRFLVGEAVDAAGGAVSSQTLDSYASRAKARTADTAREIAKAAIQMHGAIGFSDEYDLGLYAKRILVVSAWLGGAEWHRRRFAALGCSAQAE